MTTYVKGTQSQAYLGVNADSPPNMLVINRAPTTADTKNVNIGDFWLNSTTQTLYQLTSLAKDIATWIIVAVPAGVGADIFNTDAGVANTNLQTIVMQGGNNINTSGAGNTVTYNLNNTVAVTGTITAGTGLRATTGGISATGDLLITADTGSSIDLASDTTAEITAIETITFNTAEEILLQGVEGTVLSNGTESVSLLTGTGNPNGTVNSTAGSLFLSTAGAAYVNTGGTAWTAL